MSTSSDLPYRRLLAELLVIVLGVMVALAGDRWVSAIDEREREASYLQQLVSNLEADSVALGVVVARAESRHRFAVEILEGRVDASLSPQRVLASIEQLAWWVPIDYSREAWDDLVTTGALTVIQDDDLRRALSAYYNVTEGLAIIESDWARQFGESSHYRLDFLPPLLRLQITDALLPESNRMDVSDELATQIARSLVADHEAAADIGNLALMYRYQASMFGVVQEELGVLLQLARGAL